MEYDPLSKNLKLAAVINQAMIARLNVAGDDVKKKTRIVLDVFTWGVPHMPAASKVSPAKAPCLDYFLRGFHGYIKVKR